MSRLAILLVLVTAVLGYAPGYAAFTAVRATAPNTFGAAGTFPSYQQRVLTDNPVLYQPLDETVGPTAADSSGNGATGTMRDSTSSAAVFGNAAAPTGTSASVRLNAQGRTDTVATVVQAAAGPQTFSVEVWFRTTSSSGGKLLSLIHI